MGELEVNPVPPERENKNGFLIGLIIVVVIAVLGILLVYFNTNRRAANQGPEIKPLIAAKETTQKPTENEAAQTTEDVTPTEKTIVGNEEKPELEFQLTGCIIYSKLKSAFILNTLTNNEQLYQEGGFLHSLKYGRWTIYKIAPSEVILHQYYPDGSVAKEYVMKLMEKSASEKGEPKASEDALYSFTMGAKKPEVPKVKESIDLTKPEDLDKAMKETTFSDMMKLVHGLPETLIQSVLNNIPAEYIKQKLEESSLANAITEDTFKNVKPADVVNNLRKVADDFTPKGERVLAFTPQVNKDNSAVTSTNIFTPDTRRIYTCFKNEGVLAKLNTVIIKWTNTSTQKIYNWGAFPLSPASPYNYIYLNMEKDANWEPGNYLVTLYKHIQDVDPVACGEFEVK